MNMNFLKKFYNIKENNVSQTKINRHKNQETIKYHKKWEYQEAKNYST